MDLSSSISSWSNLEVKLSRDWEVDSISLVDVDGSSEIPSILLRRIREVSSTEDSLHKQKIGPKH